MSNGAHAVSAALPDEAPPVRAVGSDQFERYLTVIVGGFGVLFALQSSAGLIAAWPSVRGPLGLLSDGLFVASVVVALAPIAVPRVARGALLAAVAAYAAAIVVWPLALHGPVPTSAPPPFADVWPIEGLYLIAAIRRPILPVLPSLATLVATVYVQAVLATVGGMSPPEIGAATLPMIAVSAVLFMLVASIRWRVARAEAEHEVSVAEFSRARADDATEAERTRTDALIHDSVLTTFLAAAGARSPDATDLARRMAANAQRVLAHVNRSADFGPAVPLQWALGEPSAEVDRLRGTFEIRSEPVADLVVPVTVARTIVAAMLSAMDDCARRGTAGTVVFSTLGPDGVRVVVRDGPGLDLSPGPDRRTALREAVIDPMRRIDGRADVGADADGRATVTISWGSVVITGTEPQDEPERPVLR